MGSSKSKVAYYRVYKEHCYEELSNKLNDLSFMIQVFGDIDQLYKAKRCMHDTLHGFCGICYDKFSYNNIFDMLRDTIVLLSH